MIFQLTHNYTLLKDFFGIETNLDQNELEKLLFYVESIHMEHMPNLPYVLDDSLSEKDVIELLPILYKDMGYEFRPVYQKPEQEFITIDLWDIENSYRRFKPILSEINEKYAIPNATLSLMKFYQNEVNAKLKKEYVINNDEYQSIDENTKNYNQEADILQKIVEGEVIKAEWKITSFLEKNLTGMKFISTGEKEILV
ncbi:hypothetical protein ACT4XR_20375 (plasmid) [Acinetobacter baumannii]|uniref:hypothetical protein n=1 Tax=Acinetobacter baumannii TaxID=470 RepID=UPI0038915712